MNKFYLIYQYNANKHEKVLFSCLFKLKTGRMFKKLSYDFISSIRRHKHSNMRTDKFLARKIQINTKEEGYLRTSEDRNILADCALMMWLAEQSKENFTVGLQWAGDYHCGAVALSNGKFTEFIVSTDAVME